MKSFRKGIAVVLALATFVACSASCAKKTGKSGEGSLYAKKLELTVWDTYGTDYVPEAVYDSDVVAKWLEEKTNVTVKNMYGNDGGQWDAKLSKLVASGNMPDIVHCGAYQGPAHFAKLDQMDMVWEITPELLKEYAPNVLERIPQSYWEGISVDGKILGIPYNGMLKEPGLANMSDEDLTFALESMQCLPNDVTYSPTQCLYIRDDILKAVYPEAKSNQEFVDQLNETGSVNADELLDIPINSTEEFIDFMYKIRDLGLKEDGKTVYAFGYDGGDNWAALTWLGADMYGYKGHSYSATWNSETERMEVPLTREIIKQAAKTQNQMINDRVIDVESLAHTANIFNEKVLNGQYAIVPLALVGGAVQINEQLKAAGKSFQYRPFITQVPAAKGYNAFTENQLWGESLCLLKTLSEDEMHQVLNWINVQFSDEYDQVRMWGPAEAGLYTEDENGKRTFTDEKFNSFFIDGDSKAFASAEEKLGLGGKGGLMMVVPNSYSKWTPNIMHRKTSFKPMFGSGFRFSSDSEHTKDIAKYPPCQIWSSCYANVPEAVDFWAARGMWENKIKLAFAAENSEEFEKRWADMLATVDEICDVQSMEDKMTEIAKTLLS